VVTIINKQNAADSAEEPEMEDGKPVVTPIDPDPYPLDELLAGITPDNLHTEVNWGAPVGNEVTTQADNQSEYDDPLAYDLENSDFAPEGPFYLALAGEVGGPVLELGCGTGRFTIPLARAGIDVTGLDLSAAMLDRAREKAGDLPITWVEADARDYALGRLFRLVFESGATFQHMLTRADQLAFLALARHHLSPDGLLVVAALTPTPDLMTDEAGEYPWFSYANDEGQEVQVSGWQTYDPATQIRTETAVRRWTDAAGRAHERRSPLRLRLTRADELNALLAEAGLAVVARFGDFDRSPWTAESRFTLVVCARSH
jgi:SAM-dependent methyltransferase